MKTNTQTAPEAQKQPQKPIRVLTRDVPGYVAMIALCTIMVLPFLWMVLSSFKPKEELFRYPPTFWPERWTLANYKSLTIYAGFKTSEIENLKAQGVDMTDIYATEDQGMVLKDSSLLRVYFNALRIFFFAAIGTIVVGGLAGYAFAKIDFPGREALLVLVLSSMMIPWMTLLLPRFIMFRVLGWVGTPLPLFMPELLFGTSFAIFFFRQHFHTIPTELIESALMDGASHWQIFWRLMLPLSKTVTMSVIMFTLLSKWNDLVGPLVYLTYPKQYTPPQIIYHLMRAIGNEIDPAATGLRMAGAIMTILPVVITFFFAQRYFVSGLTSGAVKE